MLRPLLVLALLAPSLARAEDRPPNIVLIVADDLGWSDVACNGGDLVETPRIDRLAAEGVRFTRAYAPAPVCTPTRAAILTGKAPARLHMTIWSEGATTPPTNRKLLPAESMPNLARTETTLAKHLQAAGYLTAVVGKWHLGDGDLAPETHGFDVNIGGTRWGAPHTFWWPYRGAGRYGGEFRYVPDLGFGKSGDYLTDRLTDEALRVIDQAGDRPFFLYLTHHAPHTPIEAKPDDVAHFRAKLSPETHHQNPTYAAMIHSLDQGVGRVLDRLRSRGLDQNTLVVFTSDNGGYIGVDAATAPGPITSNHPLRSGKGSCYEGGLRVPLIVRGPSVAAGRTCETPVILTDLFLTLMDAARLPRPEGLPADGLSLAPLLRDPSARLDRTELFWHYPHYYHAPPVSPVGAIRSGDWKLVEFFEDPRVELYDLAADPSESLDLAPAQPDRARELKARLASWREKVGALMPGPNPAYRPPAAR